MVAEGNATSERLDKKRAFEIMILSGPAAGLPQAEAKVMIKMANLQTGNRWMLSRSNFIDRRFMMQKLMMNAEADSGDESEEEDEEGGPDPFHHEPDFVTIGCATCFLDSLTYNIEFDEKVNIVDYKGRNEGQLHVSVYPANENGVNFDPEDVNEDPNDLLDKPMYLKLTIHSATGITKNTKLKVTFLDPYDDVEHMTAELEANGSATWNFEHLIKVKMVDSKFLQWLQEGSLTMFVKAFQTDDLDPAMYVGARENTMLDIHGNAVSGGGGGGGNAAAELAKAKSTLATVLQQFKEGERDAASLVAAIDSVVKGTPTPLPNKQVAGPTADELRVQVANLQEELRTLKRKHTMASIGEKRKTREAQNQLAEIALLKVGLNKKAEGTGKEKTAGGGDDKDSKACVIS